MGAVRLNFEKGRDDWEYGFITLQIWLDSSLILTIAQNELRLFNHEHNTEREDLKKQMSQGYVLLNHYQTLCFIKVNDLLCKTLLIGEEGDCINLFVLISRLSQRFKTLATFETYYLDYSTQVITRVKKEFHKEPGLLDKLDDFLRT